MKRPLPLTILILAALALTACGNNAPSFSGITKFIRPGDDKKAVADATPAKAQDPMARPVQVAWTSARAKKCGFYFHPQQLKSSLVSYETKQDATPVHLQKVETAYKLTEATITKKLQETSLGAYCTAGTVEEIRKDLNRHMAGDFSPTVRKQEKKKKRSGGIFALSTGEEAEPMDREKIFDPKGVY